MHAPDHESTAEAAPSTPPTEVKMTDDEGKEENVADSLAAAEVSIYFNRTLGDVDMTAARGCSQGGRSCAGSSSLSQIT